MPTLNENADIIFSDVNAEVSFSIPPSIDQDLLEFSVFCGGDDRSLWVDSTGKHAVSIVGDPEPVTGFVGFKGDKDNHLELDFAEEDLSYNNFTVVCVARLFQDGSYSTGAFMGASGGTSGGTDPATGYHGWNMGIQRTATLTRNVFNLSVLRNGTDYRQALHYNQIRTQNDVPRFRVQLMRVNASTKEYTSISFDSYDGTSPLTKETFTFPGSDTITGRLKGKTNIKLGTYNGYTGSDQCHFVYGGMFTEALTDAQIMDLINSMKDQFQNTDTIDGVPVVNGVSVAPGYTPIDLYAADIT